MDDKPIFDAEYDQPAATEAGPSMKEEVQQQEADAALRQDPRDPVKVYDTGRPYRKPREWTVING